MTHITFCAGGTETAPLSRLVFSPRLSVPPRPLQGLLSTSSPVAGFWAAAGLFAFSFFLIHLFRWAIAFYLQKRKAAREKPAPPPPRQEQRAPEKPPEKIYYIVERKKKRESSKYSEPKEFRFK
ncbi:MAG: hypothetical protein ACI4SH_02980 [Candidatus Scatosoma sp.]